MPMGLGIGFGTGKGGSGAASPSALADTFADTNSVAIQSHTPTPDGGFIWTVANGTGAIQSNKLQSATSGTTMLVYAAAASANGALSFDVTVPASGQFCFGGAARIVSATSYLGCFYTNDGGSSFLTVVEIGGG